MHINGPDLALVREAGVQHAVASDFRDVRDGQRPEHSIIPAHVTCHVSIIQFVGQVDLQMAYSW